MASFLALKTAVLLDIAPSSPATRGIEYILFLITLYLLFTFIRQHIKNEKVNQKLNSKIKQKEKALSNRMDAINRSSPVIEFDTDGIICFVNNSFLDALGYMSEELI